MTESYWPVSGPTTTLAPSSNTPDDNWWVPTKIITQPAANTSVSSTSSQATATFPQAIAAATQNERPSGYSLLTIGFKKALNYNFLISSPLSSAQIFTFLPSILNNPFQGQFKNVSIHQIVPLQSESLDYMATVAEVYFPTKHISTLHSLITNSSSPLYEDADGSAKYLAELIDPTIPLTGLVPTGDESQGFESYGSTSSDGSTFPEDDNSGPSYEGALGSSGKFASSNGGHGSSGGKTAGIVVGVVVGGCTYLTTMILLVRYFVKRQIKKTLLKDPEECSIDSSDSNLDLTQEKRNDYFNIEESTEPSTKIHDLVNNDTGPDIRVTSDGRRFQVPKISRPIATQNSLGWNEI